MNTNTVNPEDTTTDQTTTTPSRRLSGPERPALRRSYQDRMLAGVAAGLAHYFGVDPTIVRIAFVVLTIVGGAGIPLYLAGLLLIPERGQRPVHRRLPHRVPAVPVTVVTAYQLTEHVIMPTPVQPVLGAAVSRRCSAALLPTSTCASRTPNARRSPTAWPSTSATAASTRPSSTSASAGP